MAHYVLDVNGTLSDMTPISEVLRAHGAPPELARTWFASVLRDGFALSMHHRAPAFLDLSREVIEAALTKVDGLSASVADVADRALDALADLGVHPDVVPGIEALTDAGHEVTAFSNGSTPATRGLLERAGVLERVAHLLSVEDLSVWKPHPSAYAFAVAALGAQPSDLTLVAVHPWDLDGAASAGLRTAWLDRDTSPWPSSFRPPDLRIRALTGLLTA